MEKVYCKECKHFNIDHCCYYYRYKTYDPITGESATEIKSYSGQERELNKRNNCKFFEQESLFRKIMGYW